jgi:hypothetical protein
MGHIRVRALRVLQMELTALPGHPTEHRLAGGVQPFMCITDNELHPAEPPHDELLPKRPPMDLMLAQRHGNTENFPFAVGIHACGDEYGRVADLSVLAHLFIAGIQKQVTIFAQWSAAPWFQGVVE